MYALKRSMTWGEKSKFFSCGRHLPLKLVTTGYPRHRENRENGHKNSLSGKTQGIWKFCQNTGNFVKTQGILLAQVVNALILKVKDITIFAAKENPFFSRSWVYLPSQFFVCNTHKLCKLAKGKFAVGQGKHREFENTI